MQITRHSLNSPKYQELWRILCRPGTKLLQTRHGDTLYFRAKCYWNIANANLHSTSSSNSFSERFHWSEWNYL